MEQVARGVVALAAVIAIFLQSPTEAARKLNSTCTRSCGNISVPYPFGIEPGCYHSVGFNLSCRNHSYGGHGHPKLYLGDGSVQVLGISIPEGTVRVKSNSVFLNNSFDYTSKGTWGTGLPKGGPFALSAELNSVAVIGCNVQVFLRGGQDNNILSSCSSICPYDGPGEVFVKSSNLCTGIGCCQALNMLEYSFYDIEVQRINITDVSTVLFFAVYLADGVLNYTPDMMQGSYPHSLPATLSWVINNSSCSANSAKECASKESFCRDKRSPGLHGYSCHCNKGYQGNAYLADGCRDIDECKYAEINNCYGECHNTAGGFFCRCPIGYTGNYSVRNGCTDIDECADPKKYSCYGKCFNYPGSFHCQCPDGTHGNPFKNGGCLSIKDSHIGFIIGLGVGGAALLLILCFGFPTIRRKVKEHRMKKVREKFFKHNYALLMQKLKTSNADISEGLIVSLSQIIKATNNFDRERILGKGGQGTVFKGIINLKVVAIKKHCTSSIATEDTINKERNDYLKEVVMLSKVKHKNVVHLLGCCLETQIPMLVYEYISNGSLSDHLRIEGEGSLKWEDRLRISTEVAGALAYLHSSATMPILHRDVKSANILLDDALRAKLSDFGISKLMEIDQLAVREDEVAGTSGYIDPKYRFCGELTEKSDVYSFGALLIELLTRKRPEKFKSVRGWKLVPHFHSLLARGNVMSIIDSQIRQEVGQIQQVAALAVMCTNINAKVRPTMKQVESALESLQVTKKTLRSVSVPRRCGEYETSHSISREGSGHFSLGDETTSSETFP